MEAQVVTLQRQIQVAAALPEVAGGLRFQFLPQFQSLTMGQLPVVVAVVAAVNQAGQATLWTNKLNISHELEVVVVVGVQATLLIRLAVQAGQILVALTWLQEAVHPGVLAQCLRLVEEVQGPMLVAILEAQAGAEAVGGAQVVLVTIRILTAEEARSQAVLLARLYQETETLRGSPREQD